MIKITKQILLLVIILLIITGFYFGYNYFLDSKARNDAKKLSEKELYIKNKFKNLVDDTKLKDGFWYVTEDEYGNRTITFFDPTSDMAMNLTSDEIDAIYNAAKNAKISGKDSFESVPEDKLPPNLQLYNSVIASPMASEENKYFSIKDRLVDLYKKGKATKDDLIQLAYIYTLEGKYSESDLINKNICKNFKLRCVDDLKIEIRGIVKDARGWVVQNAKVSIFGDDTLAPVLTNENGAYLIKLGVNELQKVRLKVTKKGYSDAVVNIIVLNSVDRKYQAETAVINSSNYIFTLDNIKKTVTGLDNKIENGKAIIKTSQSTYSIPLDAFYDKYNNKFFGQVDITAYEFTRDTVPISIMAVDTFDAARGYAGNLMQSFGMPYIQFYDKDGNLLYVKKSYPITLTYKMYHMNDLYSGKTGIYEPVTKEEVQNLLDFCKNSSEKYPINRQFLIDNQFLKFPAWWIFDQSKGVWGNEGYRLLDSEGTQETIFYTLKDVI